MDGNELSDRRSLETHANASAAEIVESCNEVTRGKRRRWLGSVGGMTAPAKSEQHSDS